MTYRSDLPPVPGRMRRLPVDERGYPVPWFVANVDGRPDFRVVRPGGVPEAHRNRLCWLCGGRRGNIGAFVIGPMCAVNRTTSEPPSHPSCALFAVRACPFLTRPEMARSPRALPGGSLGAPGLHLLRNPGAACLWQTDRYAPFDDGRGGTLFEIGPPLRVEWYCRGRAATRAEVLASIEGGLPRLRELAEQSGEAAELEAAVERVMWMLPREEEAAR